MTAPGKEEDVFWQQAARSGEQQGDAEEQEWITLAGERADPELIPWEALREASAKAWSKNKETAIQTMNEPAGSRKLRSLISAWRQPEGDEGNGADELLLAPNGLMAAGWVIRWRTKPSDIVLVETPADPEMLRLLRCCGTSPVQVPGDAEGMLPDALEAASAKFKPRLAIVSPRVGSPFGGSGWSLARREALLRCAAEHEMTVLEWDGPGLTWRDPVAPSLYTLRREMAAGCGSAGSGVIMIGSLEPHLPPLGFVRAAGASRGALLAAKEASVPPGAALFGERVLEHLLAGPKAVASGFAPAAFEAALGRVYTARRRLVLSLLKGPSWHGTAPLAGESGGRHLWVRLPDGCSSESLLRASKLAGATFLPGPEAYAQPAPAAGSLIRLTLTGNGREPLRTALDRIATALGEFTARS